MKEVHTSKLTSAALLFYVTQMHQNQLKLLTIVLKKKIAQLQSV